MARRSGDIPCGALDSSIPIAGVTVRSARFIFSFIILKSQKQTSLYAKNEGHVRGYAYL